MRIVISALTLALSTSLCAQKFEVKIVDQKDNETEYTYFVPGYSTSQSNASANCYGTDTTVNCNGSGTTNSVSTPAHQVSYSVRGATFSLQLPMDELPWSIARANSKNVLPGEREITGVVDGP